MGDFWFFCTRRLVGWARARFWGAGSCHGIPGCQAWLHGGSSQALGNAFGRSTHFLVATPPSQGRGMGHRWIWGQRATVASPESAFIPSLGAVWCKALAQPVRGCVTAGDRLFPGPARCRIRSKKGEFPHSHPARRKGCVAPHQDGNWDARGGDNLPTVATLLCHPSRAAAAPPSPGPSRPWDRAWDP